MFVISPLFLSAGTYNGHEGAVWALDVNFSSTLLLTGSADTTARLWDVQSGRQLFVFPHRAPVRSVGFAEGDQQILTVGDKSLGQDPMIFVWNLAADLERQEVEPARYIGRVNGHAGKINQALWGPSNTHIFSASDDSTVRVWDVESEEEVAQITDHTKGVNSIEFSADKSMFITASLDQTARLYDTATLTLLKTFETDRPLNSAAVSPQYHHVLLGGGQDAASVTTTGARSGKFEAMFYSCAYNELYGTVKGHFGPINSLAFSPDCKSFATGGEDGYIRLHHFDSDVAKVLATGEEGKAAASSSAAAAAAVFGAESSA